VTVKQVSVTLVFDVVDEPVLVGHAAAAVDKYGNGHELNEADLGECIVEALLNSNPGVGGYLDYGIELISTSSRTQER
jgi:hypothetical protein